MASETHIYDFLTVQKCQGKRKILQIRVHLIPLSVPESVPKNWENRGRRA